MEKPKATKRPVTRLLRRTPLHQETVSRLRDMIVEGELAAGQRLYDSDLSQRLGVSPTPVHEALRVLTSEGLVERLPGRGCQVAAITVEGVRQLFEAIAGIERTAAVLAVGRIGPDGLVRLESLQADIEAWFAACDRVAYSRANQEIHDAIVGFANNPTLEKVHGDLMVRARRARYLATLFEDRWEQSVAEHARILDAIRSGDAEHAGRLLFEHVLATGAVLARNLDNTVRSGRAKIA